MKSQVSEIYEGTVKHVSKNSVHSLESQKAKMAWSIYLNWLTSVMSKEVEDVLAIGDKVKVKVIEIDRQGRINLSRKALLPKEKNKLLGYK